MKYCIWCDEKIMESVSWHRVFGLSAPQPICKVCRSHLEPILEPLCERCGRSLREEPNVKEKSLCLDCVRWEKSDKSGILVRNRSLYAYNSFLKDRIARLKFRRDGIIIEGFRNPWRKLGMKEFPEMTVVPIPLSAQRLYERGFNQARELARLLPHPCCEALERPVHGEKQSKKNRYERLHLHTSVFRLTKDASEIKGKRVVLVDDIYTTGATLYYAAKVLRIGGASEVFSLTLARG